MPRGSTRRWYLALLRGQRYHARHADEIARARVDRGVGEQGLKLFPDERFLLEQCGGHTGERATGLGEQPHGLDESVVREPRLLAVAKSLRLFRQRVVVRTHRP